MAQLQQKDLTFTSVSVVVKISLSSLSEWLSLSFFFMLQSVVDQMWNCNKDL